MTVSLVWHIKRYFWSGISSQINVGTYTLDILFRKITRFIKVRVAFVFGLQTL